MNEGSDINEETVLILFHQADVEPNLVSLHCVYSQLVLSESSGAGPVESGSALAERSNHGTSEAIQKLATAPSKMRWGHPNSGVGCVVLLHVWCGPPMVNG